MNPKNIETRFATRTHSYFKAFGTVVNHFYLEIGIYFVGLFNASIVAWGVYTELMASEQPPLYAILLGLVTLIAVEGLGVYLVTAAAVTKSTWLWVFSILFAAFFTFAHIQETAQPGVIVSYITWAIPFFIVIGYWARIVKLESDATNQRLEKSEEDDRQREQRITDENRARKQQIEDEERHHKQQMALNARERGHNLKMAKLQQNHVKTGDVKDMPNLGKNYVKHDVFDINLGNVNSQKRLSKTANLDTLRQLLTEDPNRPVKELAELLGVNRQTIYNYKKELTSNGAV